LAALERWGEGTNSVVPTALHERSGGKGRIIRPHVTSKGPGESKTQPMGKGWGEERSGTGTARRAHGEIIVTTAGRSS